ncbi:hypothetical protein SAMN05216588_110160 [Pseudomonas flavescens]|uniref:Uncharacterized protein n=1 Tax=Phytopseudomonas flavescens TaxID=29435 RepID=A0A1G8HDF8_9GAMM|nr:hypothetical protein [Pseudomonas flavescens]SDI04673.1 hypothetical protein SAMN05216588_110160 [Pseudomonas flavescens]
MFDNVLIANRGDRPQRGAAAQPKCPAGVARVGGLSPENHDV